MRKFVKDIFTGIDGQTFDIGRVLWAFSTVFSHIVYGVAIYRGLTFDWVSYGAGNAAIHTTFGANLLMKANTEPKQ